MIVLTFNYSKIATEYTTQQPTGQARRKVQSCWDFQNDKEC